MPATPARIAFITQPYRKALTSVDATVAEAYGDLARETNRDEPIETFFDSAADAQIMAEELLDLLKVERQRFHAGLPDGLNFALSLDYSQTTPTGTVIDPEREVSKAALTSQITFDFRTGNAALEMWG